MNKEIINIYLDFIDYYNLVKDKLNYIYKECEEIDWLYEHINENLIFYYENKDNLLNNLLTEYFEKEEFLVTVIDKIKKTNSYIFDVYYNILNQDNDLFKSYVMLFYYISILEDYMEYSMNNNLLYDYIEEELDDLKSTVLNKFELVNGFDDYLTNKINDLIKNNQGFVPSIFIFNIMDKIIHTEDEEKKNFIESSIEDFNNNVISFEDLYNEINNNDKKLFFQILKLENIIRKLILAKESNTKLFDNNNYSVICALIIELTNYYNCYLTELHRVYDIYGIDYVVKYSELIRCAALIKDTIITYGDIIDGDFEVGDNYLGMYESILEINMNDFEQFIDGGKDLIDQFCEEYELIINKLEEQIEFLNTLLYNK